MRHAVWRKTAWMHDWSSPETPENSLCSYGVGADLSAKGCEAAPKQATLVVSGAPRRLVLLPVPGSSRTSPLLQEIADK
ncbi:hypothetical protein ALP36_101899 [Pseudomonas syringae pv. coriandricola]|uniref:Uncharacterized protein n=1 Tax=Pseudomonas syringae pv. coriandricola TaxID=264453 RepID=A0A3M5RB19_9PSED|nr:hypothetical protein ALP36_101899 [Pseudomonas syringae pv. coriandricola]